MRTILLGLAVVASASLVAVQTQAADTSDGCGLGWQVTSKTSFSATSTRSTTNLFVPPTFGMTSGTLGCAKHSLVQKKDEAAAFYAVENYDSLREEMAEGRGENLRAFASLMGCGSDSYGRFSQMIRSNFASIAAASDAQLDLVINIRSEIERDPALARGCGAS